jgi:hypothetical protein
VKYSKVSKIILIGTPWESNTHHYQLHFFKLKVYYSVHKSSPLVSVTSGSLCKLYHRSPVLIIFGCTFLERTSISTRRTIHQTTILTYFNQNYTTLPMEWYRQYTNIFAFLHLPLWRWPNEWPKHVGDRYVIKLRSQKGAFVVF